MTPFEIIEIFKPDRFEPFVIVAASGDRYPVRHPEMAQVAENGTVYVFEPSDHPNATVRGMTRLAYVNITDIEPAAHRQTTGDTE